MTSAILFKSGIAQVQAATAGIDARQANHAARISQCVAKKGLNVREAGRLRREQVDVRECVKMRAVADGKVTARGRVRVEVAQDRQIGRIREERHDAQRAW